MSDSETDAASSTEASPISSFSRSPPLPLPARNSSLSRPGPSDLVTDLNAAQSLRDQERRDNIIAMDRKRRLTGSATDSGRRRYNPGRSSAQLIEDSDSDEADTMGPPPSTQPPSQQREIVDLTGSSPPPFPRPQQQRPSRTSSSSSRQYVVPRWQPDSEVSNCPICGRQFTWLFRRHHCRKCGRVVCNECSPHRITIPRQFIVNPPDTDMSTSPTRPTTSGPSETIDLTGDDDDAPRPMRRPLDGGEKVRLCNPCVPDPQPEPLSTFPPFLERHDSGSRRLSSSLVPTHRPHTNILGQPTRHRSDNTFTPSTSMPNRNDLFGQHSGRPRPSSIAHASSMISPGLDPRFDYPRPTRTGSTGGAQSSQHPLPPLPSSLYSHGRYTSLDSRDRFNPDIYRRSRGTSSLDPQVRDRILNAPPHRSNRPRLNEEDICPVCRRALPAKGVDGDETLREAHIMDCITSRDPNTATSGEGSSSRPAMMHMVAFTASEKDCVGEDGNVQECSICMIEYDPGDELARLECFCKFHKLCIVSWLNRKAECPVHKASSMHY